MAMTRLLDGACPAQRENWNAITAAAEVILDGDMSAHSAGWKGRASDRRDVTFWDDLVKMNSLFFGIRKEPPE